MVSLFPLSHTAKSAELPRWYGNYPKCNTSLTSVVPLYQANACFDQFDGRDVEKECA